MHLFVTWQIKSETSKIKTKTQYSQSSVINTIINYIEKELRH